MRVYPDLMHARLLEVLHYDSDTGIWTWKVRTGPRVKVGARAGCISTYQFGLSEPYRYRGIGVDGVQYRSARLAYFYMKGEWPPKGFEVDHKSTDSLDDRWDNLRLATSSQQKINQRLRIDNALGIRGVSYHKESGLYRARIRVNGKDSVTYHKTAEKAAEARRNAEKEGHGEFANDGFSGAEVIKPPQFYPSGSRKNPLVWEVVFEGECSICGKSATDANGLESHPNPCMDGNFSGYLCQSCYQLVRVMEMYGREVRKAAIAYLHRHERAEEAA